MVDAITFEVIRHKLWAIGDEQEITLKSVSGSPVVTESCDFNNGIYLPNGDIVMLGRQVIVHAGTMSAVLKSVIQDCRADPGIDEGDMFITNDPYRGAAHAQDLSVVAPIFYRGELVAWFGACAHQLDVGGIDPGSWCPTARERVQEGLVVPPVKLVERGKTRKDVLNMVLANSRLPFLLGLDIRAMIAANNVAKKRFLALVDSYGMETVRTVMERLLDASETKLRRRLRELPDGTYRAVDFLDHDGFENKLYKLALTVVKKDDGLTFDFTGSSNQAPGFINSCRATSIGGILTGLFPILAYDIPWNDGLMRAVNVILPRGSIVDPVLPAPAGSGPTAVSWVLQNAAIAALSRLVACSDRYRREAQGVTEGAFVGLNIRGRNQYGEPFGSLVVDVIGGGGAYSFKDGLDPAKGYGIVVPNIANVEWNENFAPILYSHRSMIKDTGGPGKFRGGCAGSMAFVLHDTAGLEGVLVCHGVEVPNSAGVFGAYPGSCNVNTLIKGADARATVWERRQPLSPSSGGEKKDLGAKPGRFSIGATDIFEYSWQGGGGYGDPLDRDPQLVRRDVAGGLVSVRCAADIYGVTVDAGTMTVDGPGTERLRSEIRRKRLETSQPVRSGTLGVPESNSQPDRSGTACRAAGATQAGTPAPPVLRRLGEWLGLVAVGEQTVVRCHCGHVFGPGAENWKNGAVRRLAQPSAAGPVVKLHGDLEMREYFCPQCARLHSVEIALKSDPPLWEIEPGEDRRE